MNKEKTPYNPTPGDYDTELLTDIHSPTTKPSSYARNIQHSTSSLKSNGIPDSADRNINLKNNTDSTERIPTLIKYSDINEDSNEIDKKGEI